MYPNELKGTNFAQKQWENAGRKNYSISVDDFFKEDEDYEELCKPDDNQKREIPNRIGLSKSDIFNKRNFYANTQKSSMKIPSFPSLEHTVYKIKSPNKDIKEKTSSKLVDDFILSEINSINGLLKKIK